MQKYGIVLTESERDSLDRFMRRESPLTTFARSIRGEAAPADQTTEEPDLLKGIDIDNLPDDIVSKLKEANAQFCNIAKSQKESEALAKKNEEIARNQQSRADRNYELLRKHNLVDANGNPPSTGNADEAEKIVLQQLTEEFTKLGIDSKIAETHAKLQLKAQKVLEPNLFKKISQGLNPALETISDMHAGRLLAEAQLPKNDPEGLFTIPEIQSQVQESLDLLVKQGSTITKDTINNLRNMAYGQYMIETPADKQQKPNKREETGMKFSTKGSRYGGGGNAPDAKSATLQGGPRAADADTQRAIDATVAAMTRGLTLKKGGK